MTPDPTPPTTDRQPVMARIAARLRMTEGQLYTAVLAAVVVILLSLTGLPNARQRSNADGLSGPTVIEAPPAVDSP
jgi:hypothetical protein